MRPRLCISGDLSTSATFCNGPRTACVWKMDLGEELELRTNLRKKGVAIQAGAMGHACRAVDLTLCDHPYSLPFLIGLLCKGSVLFGQVAEGSKSKPAQYRWLYDRKR